MYHCGPCSLSAAALNRLLAYSWPGNVRELENAMERAVVLAEGKPKIEESDLPLELLGANTETLSTDEELLPLVEIERRHILRVLERCGGNRKETAKVLGVAGNTLWRKLRAYGLMAKQMPRPANAGSKSSGQQLAYGGLMNDLPRKSPRAPRYAIT